LSINNLVFFVHALSSSLKEKHKKHVRNNRDCLLTIEKTELGQRLLPLPNPIYKSRLFRQAENQQHFLNLFKLYSRKIRKTHFSATRNLRVSDQVTRHSPPAGFVVPTEFPPTKFLRFFFPWSEYLTNRKFVTKLKKLNLSFQARQSSRCKLYASLNVLLSNDKKQKKIKNIKGEGTVLFFIQFLSKVWNCFINFWKENSPSCFPCQNSQWRSQK